MPRKEKVEQKTDPGVGGSSSYDDVGHTRAVLRLFLTVLRVLLAVLRGPYAELGIKLGSALQCAFGISLTIPLATWERCPCVVWLLPSYSFLSVSSCLNSEL